MNILAFSNCPLDPVLGSGKTRLAWSAGLRKLGHQVRILASDELVGSGSRVGDALGQRRRLAWQAWRLLAEMSAVELGEIDLIEFYGSEFWLPTWLLARRKPSRRPLLVAHTDGLEPLAARRMREAGVPEHQALWRTWMIEGCGRLAFSRADALVVGCEADRRFALNDGLIGREDCVATISPGLDEEFVQAAAAGERSSPPHLSPGVGTPRGERVAFLGSWIPRKGIRHLVAIMHDLLLARPGLRLSIGGMGPRVSVSSLLCAFAPGLRDRVDVLPAGASTAECLAMLARSQVFIFPSEYEGFGLALAEAMACGCAAVTTPTGLGADLRDGEEALVCPFGDQTRMRLAVERLLDDEALRARLAAAGRQRARDLRWEASVRRLESTYEDWLETKRAAGSLAEILQPPIVGSFASTSALASETPTKPSDP